MASKILTLTGEPLSLEQIRTFITAHQKIKLSAGVKTRVNRARAVVEKIADGDVPVYGINTGFGNFSETKIGVKALDELQKRLVHSHAAGVGKPVPREIVRLILLLKIQGLSMGYSGCRMIILESLAAMINADVLPFIPEKGSVGASGDLAPLAHLALVLLGGGSAFVGTTNRSGQTEWNRREGSAAIKMAGLQPLKLAAKEGLAILNGTQVMTAYAVWSIIRAKQIVKSADIIGAMTLEALLGTLTPFDARIQNIRNHPGQKTVAANIRRLLKKSPIVASHKYSDHKVQDAYSLRCIPQVHGAIRDALDYVENVIEREVNGVTDNPLVFPEKGDVLSGGNFHGAPVAIAADLMAIVLTDLASISERRIEHTLDPAVSNLPAFLVENGGLNSGFMIAHVSAASLVSECKVLAHPASIDSIPTSANKEDHVSMGTHAAREAFEIIYNLENVLAVELLCACQALDFRKPLKPSEASGSVYRTVRRVIPYLSEDRVMHRDISLARELIKTGKVIAAAEKICGALDQ